MRFLQFMCVLAMACFPLMSMAGDNKHYSKVTAIVNPTGAGKVYVATSTTNNLGYQENSHSNGQQTGALNPNQHTYYLYAQANDDYNFSGWYQDNSKKSSDNPYTVKVDYKVGEAAEYTYEARFTHKDPSLTVSKQALEMEARPNTQVTATFTVEGQHIYDSGVDLSVNNNAFTVSPTHLTKAQAQAKATITVTYKPTANQDYTGKVTISTEGVSNKEVTLNGYSTGCPVSIGSAGATTLYVDMPLVVPSNDIYADADLRAFYASDINDKEGGKKDLTLTSLKNNIPANTGVVITGAQGDYYFMKYRGSSLSPVSGNLLSGTTTGAKRKDVLDEAPAGSIVMTLNKQNGVLAFYKYTGVDLAANKAYLVYTPSAGSNVSYISIGGGEDLDGIRDAKAVKVDDAWYTLQGARLSGEPTQRGIYIHGGKKVMVK